MSLNQLLVAMLSVGGFGFLNFVIADNIGTVEFKNYSTPFIVGYSILWSILDVFVFNMFTYIFDKRVFVHNVSVSIWLSLSLTLLFAVILTPFIALKIEKWMNAYYLHFRNRIKKDSTLSLRGPLISSLANKHDLVYIFDLNHNLLMDGSLVSYNPDYFEFEFFNTTKYRSNGLTYEILMKGLNETNRLVALSNIACNCYVNLKQNYIIVVVPKEIIALFNKMLAEELNNHAN